jgi:hypothetical protein
MALSDIPEYQRVSSGDLIRAEQWNTMQRQARNSLRIHRHTRTATSAPDDSNPNDVAPQITTNEIADGAVTAVKLGGGAIGATALADGSITTTKVADNAITTTKIASAAVTATKLSFQSVQVGSRTLAPGSSAIEQVQLAAPSTKSTIYFPVLAITASTGTGLSQVVADIVYQQAVNASTVDVFVRLTNSGAATASIIWQVLTFG